MPAAAAGQKVTAAFINSLCPLGKAQSATNASFGTTTSTSFTDTLAGSGTVSVNFTAPPSGSVDVEIEGVAKNSGTAFSGTAFRLSGASARAAVDDEQFFVQGTSEIMSGRRVTVSGLVAGGAYTATMQHKVTAGTGTFNYRQIAVHPNPA